jgi:hypothetical protein
MLLDPDPQCPNKDPDPGLRQINADPIYWRGKEYGNRYLNAGHSAGHVEV